MACKHVNTAGLRPPGPEQSVYREDCTQCFDSIDGPLGLDVCLSCFNGGCPEGSERQHAVYHAKLRSHPLALNIRRTRKVVVRDQPPQKMTKLEIPAETEEDRYDTVTSVKCYECNVDSVDISTGNLASVVEGIMRANTFSRKEEVKAFTLEMETCEHILMLQQGPARKIESQDLGHCSMCELHENLWLCLECGNLGCGREQFGGLKGNSHGLAHTKQAGHSVAVKLGSLKAEGTGDIYCYACDEERLDGDLVGHLAHWGINLADRQQTEKSLTEMNIDENLRWEFSMTDEDGREFKKLFGPGFTGLKNLGNSCYLASTMQCLFALPQFQARYSSLNDANVFDPAQDLETQLRKLGDGLLSGRYAVPDPDYHPTEDSAEIAYQKGLPPSMLKVLIGKGHEEFQTMRQQDAFEFLLHVFKLITRSQHPPPLQDPTRAFRFVMEQRLQCQGCKKVRYSTVEQDNISISVPLRVIARPGTESQEPDEYEPVTLKECLDNFTAIEEVELTCSACSEKSFLKQSLFKTFPEVLAVNAKRFKVVQWVPTKVNVALIVGDEPFLLDDYKSMGQQVSEELLPEHLNDNKPPFEASPAALSELQNMGMAANRAEKALYFTGNTDTETALNWLLEHMDDADIDDPLVLASVPSSDAVDPDKILQLTDFGIGVPQARKALKETGGNVERAADWAFNHPDDPGDFDDDVPVAAAETAREEAGSSQLPAKFQLHSIICHKGVSVHSGHYVAFIRKDIEGEGAPTWVLYNDEKVAKANDVEEMKNSAYVYFFQRI